MRSVNRRLLGVMVLVAALAAGCSADGDTPPGGTEPTDPGALAACALLTAAEAGKALDLSGKATRGTNTNTDCDYDAINDLNGTISFNLVPSDGDWTQVVNGVKGTVRSGEGDVFRDEPTHGAEAFSIEGLLGPPEDKVISVTYYVRKSGKMLVLSAARSGSDDKRPATKAGADFAVTRILNRM